jgi:hypothetical protein
VGERSVSLYQSRRNNLNDGALIELALADGERPFWRA